MFLGEIEIQRNKADPRLKTCLNSFPGNGKVSRIDDTGIKEANTAEKIEIFRVSMDEEEFLKWHC